MIPFLAAPVLAPTTPLTLARNEIESAAGAKATNVVIKVEPGVRESYRITSHGSKVTIVGGDSVGAMYGAFEFSERLRNEGASAWRTNVSGKPYLPERGVNLFLTLPWDYKKNDTDYDLAGLTNPDRWWFQNEDYWRTLLDLMAHSRLNWLDIHGMWDISVTDAPNLYAYFVQSDLFPSVGAPSEVKAANLRQLNHVIEMAHARGIKVSLMAYQADPRIPQNRTPPYSPTEANVYSYTRDVVERMIREAPGLDAIGFRIGESGKSESFFKCYEEAVKRSGRNIPLITRSWVTTRQKVLPLARASDDFTVEIKYNGEHWAAPYIVAGGRVANWGSYSFEDYLSDAGSPEKNRRTWIGWPTSEGGHWPSEPYKIVWQVRANGTHRIFPFYNPEWTRRTILEMKMGTASGYTVEGEDAYFPKSPDYYLANPKDKYCNWIHQRDELYWMCWGRLGYDPAVPEATFDARAKALLGPGSREWIEGWKGASVSAPLDFLAHSLGPDHRSHAPELEWGGDTDAFIHGQGFDTHVIEPIDEQLANKATGGVDGRVRSADFVGTPVMMAVMGDPPPNHKDPKPPASRRGREIANAIHMEDALAQYVGDREMAARQMALTEGLFGKEERSSDDDWTALAIRMHQQLSGNPFYRPFTDKLRMHTNAFSWTQEHRKLLAEADRIGKLPRAAAGSIQDVPDFDPGRFDGLANLGWTEKNGGLVCTLRVTDVEPSRAWLLEKPLPSSTFFHRSPMSRDRTSGVFVAKIGRPRCGLMISAEYQLGSRTVQVPSFTWDAPYQIVPAQSGPTPQIYSAGEALSYLKPEVLTPEKYSGILVGCRAGEFNHFSPSMKRKLLDPVRRGLRLVILQEDFNRFKLDWLPRPLAIQAGRWSEFDPAGALDLPKVDVPDIMWQRFQPSDGWEIFGDGGLARLKLGEGEIWVTTARVMQLMQYPAAAKAFVRLLSLGGKAKPTVLVDSCSESADSSSSCHPDLMNSHEIPFLTLGEVIYSEQGMESFTPVPGPISDDDVLDGHGVEQANRFLRNQVIKLSTRPAPKSLDEFESLRKERKRELIRSLGLDPMPQRTPLNVRTTGTIQRSGYRIEKIAFESRPGFYVTGHVYVPEPMPATRLPAIVNVNGHWAHKKDEDRIQLRCAFQALRGYIAIAIDSPGFSFEGNNLIERRAEGDHNDFKLVEGGTNATGCYVWDTIRAVDYLSTRRDVDMSRLGITGASGGGLATLYAFAAEDRLKAAVPVVYMSSMELAPDNGCLCNHVPGTCQIGDRSDVIAIQAPKPVLIMGAEQDGEFPPDAMRLTQAKMAKTWAIFPDGNDTFVRIFPGGHDYSQPMREAMIGFFDRYLRRVGDGSPVPQPPLTAINPEDRQLLALDPPPAHERTMRDLAKESLAKASSKAKWDEVVKVNGGIPEGGPLNYRELDSGSKRHIVFESEPGLQTPGVLILPDGEPKGVAIVACDSGKAADPGPTLPLPFDAAAKGTIEQMISSGLAVLRLDILGTGELNGIEMRYPVYAGRSVAFTGGWQIARAAEAMRRYSQHVEVIGKGPLSSQAAMYAALLNTQITRTTGLDCLTGWSDVFDGAVNDYAVQPRANLCGSLENLRKMVHNGTWQYLKP